MAIIEDSSSPSGYRNDVTGRFAKAAVSTKSSGADDKSEPKEKKEKQSNLGATQIVSALRQEFSGLNKHLAFRFDSVIKAMAGTEAEKRDATIISGNTDPKVGDETDPPEKGNFLESVKGLNPFGKDRNPLIRILAFGALALALGSEKLQPILAKVLEWVKETFIPWISSMWTAIKDYDYQAGFDKIKLFFKQIKDFFDTNDDGEISFDEIKEGIPKAVALMAETIGKALKDGVKLLFENYGTEIAAVFAGYVGFKILATKLLYGGLIGAPGGPAGGAAMRVAGLAAIMITGLVTLHNDIKDAYTDVLERDGEVKAKTLISRFLSGDNNPHGRSWTDAILGSWKMGLQGAAVGLTAGLVTGGVFSIPLAAIGFITGATASAMGAHLGEDKLNQNMEDMETNLEALGKDLKTTGNRVYNFFKGIIDAAAAVVDKETTIGGAFNQAVKGSGQELFNQIDKELRGEKNIRAFYQAAVDRGKETFGPGSKAYLKAGGNIPSDVPIDPNDLSKGFKTKGQVMYERMTFNDRMGVSYSNEKIAVLERRKKQAMQTAANTNIRTKQEEITAINKKIIGVDKDIARFRNNGGYARNKIEIDRLRAKRKGLLVNKQMAEQELKNFGTFQSKGPDGFDMLSGTTLSSQASFTKSGIDLMAQRKLTALAIDFDETRSKFPKQDATFLNNSNTSIKQGDVITPDINARGISDTAALLGGQWPELYRQ